MLKIENVYISGWEAAIRGMRNPMNSWEKSDSGWRATYPDDAIPVATDCEEYYDLIIGPNDQKLMMALAKSGTEHAKYRRMINATVDITAPLYWWKEFDTYKVGTVANSCSTMHKIHAKEFTLEDFSCEHLITIKDIEDEDDGIPCGRLVIYDAGREDYGWEEGDRRYDDDYYEDPTITTWSQQILKITIAGLNFYRDKFLETKDKEYWWQMIQLLPSSYNQRRTVQMDYEVLAAIYRQRKDHKLDEWHIFCDWIKELPCSEIITLGENNE